MQCMCAVCASVMHVCGLCGEGVCCSAAGELKKAGANRVYAFITHGLLSVSELAGSDGDSGAAWLTVLLIVLVLHG